MALPASGEITMAMINTELGYASNATISLNDTAVRNLAGKPSGQIAMNDFYGKSSIQWFFSRITPGYWWYQDGYDGLFEIVWNDVLIVAFSYPPAPEPGTSYVFGGYRYYRGTYAGTGSDFYVRREPA